MTFKQLYRQVTEIVGDESKIVLAKNLINEVYDEVIVETKGYYNQGGLSPDITTTVAKKYQYDITSSLYDRINFPYITIPTIGDTTFTGSGLDDLTTGGTYRGSNDADVVVTIDGTGTPDTFKWSRYGGAEETTGVAITGAAQSLVNGIEITFAATTGHTSGDKWEYTISTQIYYPEHITNSQYLNLRAGGDTYSDIPQYWYMDNQSLHIWPAPATSGNPISMDVMLSRADLTTDTSEPTIKPGYHQLLVYKPASLILMMKGNINLANSYMALYEKMLKRYKDEVLFATTDVLIPRKRRRFIDPNNYPTVT